MNFGLSQSAFILLVMDYDQSIITSMLFSISSETDPAFCLWPFGRTRRENRCSRNVVVGMPFLTRGKEFRQRFPPGTSSLSLWFGGKVIRSRGDLECAGPSRELSGHA